MMMAAVLVFFPVMVNVTRGLTAVEPAALELMRSYAASEWTVLRKVRVPNALPYFFTALKVGDDAEPHRRDRRRVLRRLVDGPRPDHRQSASALRFDVTWAAIVIGAATGIVFYLVVVGRRTAGHPVARLEPSGPGAVRSAAGTSAPRPGGRRERTSEEEHMRRSEDGPGVGRDGQHAVRAPVRAAARRPLRPSAASRRQRVRVGGVGRRPAELTHGPAAAPVGAAGPVRRLLRGRRAGLLRGRGARRRRSSTAARRHPAAGRLGARRPRVHDPWVPKVLEAREARRRTS